MATLGNNILITTSDGTVYAAKSQTVSENCEMVETAVSARWRTYVAGLKDWSITTGYLVGTGKIKTDLLKVGSTVTVSIYERGKDTTTKLTGTAIVAQCQITATRGNLAQGSFIFTGTGQLG